MTNAEAKKFLTAKLECMVRYTSTSGCDDECEGCNLCYEQGNMGEQKEALRVAIKALEPKTGHWIHHYSPSGMNIEHRECSFCGVWFAYDMPRNSFCPNCGADMRTKAESEGREMSEWCTGCKEYDTEKHCCPRFNQVIRRTMNERINAVLDKIITEINALESPLGWHGEWCDGVADCLEIIDEYKIRISEGKE